MRASGSVDVPCGYVVVDSAAEQLLEAEVCQCEYLVVHDGAMVCSDCGTVYGVVYGFNRYSGRVRRRRDWRRDRQEWGW